MTNRVLGRTLSRLARAFCDAMTHPIDGSLTVLSANPQQRIRGNRWLSYHIPGRGVNNFVGRFRCFFERIGAAGTSSSVIPELLGGFVR